MRKMNNVGKIDSEKQLDEPAEEALTEKETPIQIQFTYAALSSAGSMSKSNQDRAMVEGNLLKEGSLAGACRDSLLAVLCDGVGGVACGEKAADTASSCLRETCETEQNPVTLCKAIYNANDKVRSLNVTKDDSNDYLTTVAVLYLSAKSHFVLNAGDTRVYHADGESLTLLTTDHVSIKENCRSGTGAQFSNHTKKGITQCLGIKPTQLNMAIRGSTSNPLLNGVFLMCTDGIYEYLEEAEILSILQSGSCSSDKCSALLDSAVVNGSLDDMSVVVVECFDEVTKNESKKSV